MSYGWSLLAQRRIPVWPLTPPGSAGEDQPDAGWHAFPGLDDCTRDDDNVGDWEGVAGLICQPQGCSWQNPDVFHKLTGRLLGDQQRFIVVKNASSARFDGAWCR